MIQTVFGVFHHFELARELSRRGHLQRICSTWPWRRLQREGLPRELVRSYPWVHTPEMLLRQAGFDVPAVLSHFSRTNWLSFDRFVQRQLRSEETPDALIGISGSSLLAGADVQRRGGIFICDRGSSHQRFQEAIVREEYLRWGVDRPVTHNDAILREEAIYARADAITVPSGFAKRSFVESGVPADKVHVIPYGVRLESFTPVSAPPGDRFEVLFAGSVGLRKGIPYLLEAFARLRHPAKRLRIAGSIQADLKAVLPSLPQSEVEYLGSVPQPELVRLMSTSHVLVLPSIEEGLALVQGQALACGCPVIASTNTGAEDLFTSEVEGFIVPIRDSDALLDRMQRLADNPDLQQQMRVAALERVHAIGGWTDYGDLWESLLRQLVQPPPTK